MTGPDCVRSGRSGGDASDRIVHEFLERYVAWREACAAVGRAYERWRGSGTADRVLTFAGYRAALDGEEQAARVLAECASSGSLADR